MAKKNPELTTENQEEEIVKQPAGETLEQKDAEIAKLKKMLEAAKKAAPFSTGKETDAERVHRLETETVAAGMDPWTVETDVLVPHREKTEDPWYWINVNGRSVQIPANDRYQKMKLPFACVLVDLLAYEKHSADYQDSLEVFDPETNPHK